MQYRREDVCQEGTNKFFWKYAKRHLDHSFLERLAAYSPIGAKISPQSPYTTLNFIERNVEGILIEEVDAQCGSVLAKLYKWLTLCIKTRKDDITYRRAMSKRALQSRDTLIQKEQERQVKMEQELVEAEAKFNEEHKEEIEEALKWDADQIVKVDEEYGEEQDDSRAEDESARPKERPFVPAFNKAEVLKRWLEDNPVIEIPSETQMEPDTDWVLTEEEEQALLAAYMAKDAI